MIVIGGEETEIETAIAIDPTTELVSPDVQNELSTTRGGVRSRKVAGTRPRQTRSTMILKEVEEEATSGIIMHQRMVVATESRLDQEDIMRKKNIITVVIEITIIGEEDVTTLETTNRMNLSGSQVIKILTQFTI